MPSSTSALPVAGPLPESAVDAAMVRALSWDGLIELEQLLTYTRPAYGEQWADVITTMLADPTDAETVQVLRQELTARLTHDEQATFDRPIEVDFEDPADWGVDDEAEYGPCPVRPGVANGMHRTVAAVLAGARWVKVAVRRSGTQDWDEAELVKVQATFPVAGSDLEALDAAASWLRSFRLTDTVWVEADGWSGAGPVLEWLYYCPHTLADQLKAALVARARAHGIELDIVRVHPTTWATELADD